MKPYHGVDVEPKTSLAVGQEAPSQCGHGVTSAVDPAPGPQQSRQQARPLPDEQ